MFGNGGFAPPVCSFLLLLLPVLPLTDNWPLKVDNWQRSLSLPSEPFSGWV